MNKKIIAAFVITIVCLIALTGCKWFGFNHTNEPVETQDQSISEFFDESAEDYFKKNSEIIEVVDANTSTDTKTETQALSFFAERGFDDYPVEYDFSADGEYIEKNEASEESTEKHPRYYTTYQSTGGDVWRVYLINGTVMAYPVSFNLQSSLPAELIYSETNQLTSYDALENKFYRTVPSESAIIVRTVERIDAETLDKLTLEEIGK